MDLSEIDTDDALNAENLTKSRQSRAKIVKIKKVSSPEKLKVSSFNPKIPFQRSIKKETNLDKKSKQI